MVGPQVEPVGQAARVTELLGKGMPNGGEDRCRGLRLRQPLAAPVLDDRWRVQREDQAE